MFTVLRLEMCNFSHSGTRQNPKCVLLKKKFENIDIVYISIKIHVTPDLMIISTCTCRTWDHTFVKMPAEMYMYVKKKTPAKRLGVVYTVDYISGDQKNTSPTLRVNNFATNYYIAMKHHTSQIYDVFNIS